MVKLNMEDPTELMMQEKSIRCFEFIHKSPTSLQLDTFSAIMVPTCHGIKLQNVSAKPVSALDAMQCNLSQWMVGVEFV